MTMYLCDDLCLSNEQLAQRIQNGGPEATSLLLSQNEGYLTTLARSYSEQFSQRSLVDDLKQEGCWRCWTRRSGLIYPWEPSCSPTPLLPLRRLCRTAPLEVLSLCRFRWTVTTNCIRRLFSVLHASKTPERIF